MDPGSATGLGDPARGVDRLAEAAGLGFAHLDKARTETARRVRSVSEELAGTTAPAAVSTCVFGSWARAELTDESDDDWAVLVDREFEPYDPDVVREIVAAQAMLGLDDRKPGAQGVFGGPICIPDVAANIGLDADTNTNLSRRMLILLESREVHGDVREAAIEQILGRYLTEGLRPGRPPRFLLNDVVRYWRTICVDFEGKSALRQDGSDPKWASRNLKLRTSRKLLFVGGLLPVLFCHLCETDEMSPFLKRWFNATALDRVSTIFLYAGLVDSGARALQAYDRWLELIGDKQVRDALETVTFAKREASPHYVEMRELGREFEDALSALLFSPALGRLTRTFAVL